MKEFWNFIQMVDVYKRQSLDHLVEENQHFAI